ncbi:MAG: amidohydrolase family protein [Candidatus Sumerlaeota bacterium]|nr:amidohydrolase family protein [Candidatus Sumerlaeota bacterium]
MDGSNSFQFINVEIVNSHVHFETLSLIGETREFLRSLSMQAYGLVSCARPGKVNENPQAICFKASYPEETYIFGALDYSHAASGGAAVQRDFETQLTRLMRIGFDGVKLIETKPNMAKAMPFPIDDRVYDRFFGLLEERRIPITWHVGDPEELWRQDTTLAAARARGWDYADGTFPSKEELHRRAETVLHRFPNLQVVFAHFYYHSNNLPRLQRLLDEYPGVHVDLTPGTGMFPHFTRAPGQTRDFFLQYQDRILFGDDTAIRKPTLDRRGIAEKVLFMRRFLETDGEFPMPEGDECFFRREGLFRGIRLPDPVLRKIYAENFQRLAGQRPRPLDLAAGVEECRRIGDILERGGEYSGVRNFAYAAEHFLPCPDKTLL